MNHTTCIGPYGSLEPLGQGGMGVVYRAVHVETGQPAALKTVRVPREGLLQSIRREIHALARIRHPGIVRILDEGLHDGLPWYAMELLEGTTLRDAFSQLDPADGIAQLDPALAGGGRDVPSSFAPAQPTGTAQPGKTQGWWTQSLAAGSKLEAPDLS